MSFVDTIPRHADDGWRDALAAIRAGHRGDLSRWNDIFAPLAASQVDELIVIGQIGQSLDGRAATATGHSHYINGSDGLDHLHRLRALVDAVVVGVGTAIADDPQLTVRRVAGENPARVIIDPNGRLPPTARAFRNDGTRRIVITAAQGASGHEQHTGSGVGVERSGAAGSLPHAPPPRPSPTRGEGAEGSVPAEVEHIVLDADGGHIAPAAILASLAERGFKRILIEGGPGTVARFLEARCLDRLHVVVAPIILGGGRSSLDLAPITRCEEALRPHTTTHVLGEEVLFDCDLAAQRRPIGRAKKST
jgi:diaminohydroxyphosphoribosylaminopyrimidine deaminase / 5-amino-6-(5-phosphoribosylamino)uracil reductase